jgi:hypothetical protein
MLCLECGEPAPPDPLNTRRRPISLVARLRHMLRKLARLP